MAIKDHEKISKSRWEAILNQIHLWIGKDKDQLRKIINNGWSFQDILGCHKIHPEVRIDYMGLLMLVKGRSIIRVNMGAITLQTRYGAEQTFHYKNILDRPENGEIYNT